MTNYWSMKRDQSPDWLITRYQQCLRKPESLTMNLAQVVLVEAVEGGQPVSYCVARCRAERSSCRGWRPWTGATTFPSLAQPAPPSRCVIVDTRSHGRSSPPADNLLLATDASKGKTLDYNLRFIYGEIQSIGHY